MATQRELACAALAGYVTGTTLQIGALSEGVLPGAVLIDREAGAPCDDLASIAPHSVDCIVSCFGIEHALDPVRALEEWRRVLRSRGRLALAIRDGEQRACHGSAPHVWTEAALRRLLTRVGGFEVTRTGELTGAGAFVIVAERRDAVDLRALLGTHGASMAEAAQKNPADRGELLFQFGTILMRAGESGIASRCFEELLACEPDDAECLFGLGMCRALEAQWSEAVACLERVNALDPTNREAQRWLGLARLERDAAGMRGGPQSAVTEKSSTARARAPRS